MEFSDDQRVRCVVVDDMHKVGVSTRDSTKLTKGLNELALEGVDGRMFMLLSTGGSLRALKSGSKGDGDVGGSGVLRGGEHRRVVVNQWRECVEPPPHETSEGGRGTHHTHEWEMWNQEVSTKRSDIGQGCVTRLPKTQPRRGQQGKKVESCQCLWPGDENIRTWEHAGSLGHTSSILLGSMSERGGPALVR
jgi:hypothetical protein